MNCDGSKAVDISSVQPMDRPDHHDYGTTNANGQTNPNANGYMNDR